MKKADRDRLEELRKTEEPQLDPPVRGQHPGGGIKQTVEHDRNLGPDPMLRRWFLDEMARQTPQNPTYGDFSESVDYHTALTRVREAQADFMALPSRIREFCEHDLGVFLEITAEDGGPERLALMGLPDHLLPPDPSSPQSHSDGEPSEDLASGGQPEPSSKSS